MFRIKKPAIIVITIALALVVIFFGSKAITQHYYRNQLPTLPDDGTLTDPVKEQLTSATRKATDHPTADNIGRLGMAYHSDALYDQAKQCYKLAVGKDKSKWIWNYYLGYLAQEMGDSKTEVENFSLVVKKDRHVVSAWYYLGEAYRNDGDEDKAREAFKQISSFPNNIPGIKSLRANYSSFPISAKFELARTALGKQDFDEAENLLKDILKTDKTIGPVYRLLGNVYLAKGDTVLSKKCNVRAGDHPEITTLNDTIIDRLSLISRSALYLPKQIDDAIKSANPEWAQKLFIQALQYIPDNKYVVSKAIKLYCRLNRGKLALPYLDKNLQNFSNDFGEMKDVSYLLSRKGFYAGSIPYFAQATKLAPDSLDIVGNFALSYWKNNQKDSALMLMDKLYENNRNNPDVLASEVNFMLGVENKDKAKFFLNKLKAVAPSSPKILKLAGRLAEMEGDTNAAVELFRRSFDADPSELEIAEKLGPYYVEHQMWSKAADLLRRALNYHPNESVLQEKLGTLLVSCPDANLRNVPEGLEFAERAFFNVSSSLNTVTSSGKDLVIGNAMNRDFKTAKHYMDITLSIANSQHVSQSYLQGLVKLAEQLKLMSSQP